MKIKNTLISVLHGDERAANKLCDQFRCVAVAYLRTKAARNKFLLQHLYNDINDLALDCIAELFGREKNCFTQLEEYLNREDVTALSESELFSKIRRLIFSKVNEGLYRNYKNLDPSLSKIIRNLKRNLDEEKVKGVYFNPGTGFIEVEELKEGLPVMPDELLEIKLSGSLGEISNSVDALDQLKSILQREAEYVSKIHLIAFSILLRKVFAYQLEMEEEKQNTSPAYQDSELYEFIETGIQKQKSQLIKTYVESGKLSSQIFDAYISVARDILHTDYVKASTNEGYFEHFEFHFPGIHYDRYRENHRKILEYMVKKIRDQLITEIKNEEKFSRVKVWQ
ncbi:MAG: hypothetical protein WD607_11620 [Candidatus Paceibacterota bacterium]